MKFMRDESAEKLRGGYYTDPDIAAYLIRWVREIKPTRVLEPSCGDGIFIRELLRNADPTSAPEITGFEIDRVEAAKARIELGKGLGRVNDADFLGWVIKNLDSGCNFDAVVGNPPYIRYQYLSPESQERAERIIRAHSLRFTKHTNAWVPFIVAAIAKLRPGGRLAMVVPSELLSVIHAETARTFLLRECSRVQIIDPEELWFEGALQGVVLLLAEKHSQPKGRRNPGTLGIARVQGRAFLEHSPASLFDAVSFVSSDEIPSKWTFALLSASERRLLERLRHNSNVHRFTEIASVAVGIVTGANKFFLVPDDTVAEFDLSTYAHPMFGRSEHVSGVVYDEAEHFANRARGLPANFIWFTAEHVSMLGRGAKRYIALGEAQALHTRFKCRVREPWYAVPSVFASPIGMLKRSHEFPRLILNEIDAFTTDTAYRVFPKSHSTQTLVSCFINSLTALSAELEGRHYGGGVLELVPSEINRLLVPLVSLGRTHLDELDQLVRIGASTEQLFIKQDIAVLGAIGVASSDIEDLQSAAWRLRRRRHRTPEELVDASVAEDEWLPEDVMSVG